MRPILFIKTASTTPGGIQGQIVRLARMLHHHRIFFPMLVTSDLNTDFARSFQQAGFAVHSAPLTERSDFFTAAAQIYRLVIKYDIPLIQSHMFRESLVVRWVKHRCPAVKHVSRVHTAVAPLPITARRKWLQRRIDRATSRWVDLYLANGRFVTDDLYRSLGTSSKIRTIINGRDCLGPPDPPPSESQNPLPLRLAMVANLTWGKGHDTLFEALARLKQQNIIYHAKIIGGSLANSADYVDQLKAKALRCRINNQIEWIGYTPDVYEQLKDCPIVVLPSDAEGIPNAILEAMSLRKLIIASDVGGVSELIQHRYSGFLHPARRADILAKFLTEIASQPACTWQPLRQQAFQHWHDHLQMTSMFEHFCDAYRELNLL